MSGLRSTLVLIAIGAAWGLTLPLIRIGVSSGLPPLGIVVWQQVIMAVLLLGLLAPLGLGMPKLRGSTGIFVMVAVFGAVLPGYFTFLTAFDVPAGVRALIIALVPMFALPMALVFRFERPDLRRAAGVCLGAAAIALIALPGSGVTSGVGLGVLALALIAPLSYAVEATYLGWRGADGMHPFQLLAVASALGIAFVWPLAALTGQTVDVLRPWARPEWALLAAGLLNAFAYSGYVWLVGRAGPVFASQIAYVVTAFGVLWSMLLLGETYSLWIWAAFVLLACGLACVRPRADAAKAP